jgi:hypothetical protein
MASQLGYPSSNSGDLEQIPNQLMAGILTERRTLQLQREKHALPFRVFAPRS